VCIRICKDFHLDAIFLKKKRNHAGQTAHMRIGVGNIDLLRGKIMLYSTDEGRPVIDFLGGGD